MELSIIQRYKVFKEQEQVPELAAAILVLADAIENAPGLVAHHLDLEALLNHSTIKVEVSETVN